MMAERSNELRERVLCYVCIISVLLIRSAFVGFVPNLTCAAAEPIFSGGYPSRPS